VASAIAAGLLVGFAASTIAYRLHLLRVPSASIVQRMDSDLHLTAAQKSRITEVLDSTRARMAQIHEQFDNQRRQAMNNAFSEIRATLTPDQQREFDRLYNPGSVSLRPPEQARQDAGAP
jgi:hypothetical protein